jgi:chitodextrinase
MKQKFLLIAAIAITSFSFAQNGETFWKKTTKSDAQVYENKSSLSNTSLFNLDINSLKQSIRSVSKRVNFNESSNTIISIPNRDGKMERFSVLENSNMEQDLANRYPEIKSYVGYGIDNPTATVYFSISPLGFQSMTLYADKSAEFIEPYTKDLKTYTVYRKADRKAAFSKFECSVVEHANNKAASDAAARPNADDSKLRTFRLAMSVTGEYSSHFGGTKALALAAINTTMTRVNGVFEKDFSARMVLISNTDDVIYTNASTDPYTTSYNSQLQSTLTSVIGDSNYDVGHLLTKAGNNGNAGCIGCVCNSGKGSGFTSSTIPEGDNFDIDYVAHEIGHQFGANHTFSMSNEGTGVNMEPGSGSTIMGYAGITGQDVQPHSDAYFHSASIQQVTNNIKSKTCPTVTNTGNTVPTANAGGDYTIPKSTPFILTGSGTDANGDALTYIWEQFDNAASSATGASSAASATRTSGPTFRSYNPTTAPTRMFPRLESVIANSSTTTGAEITVEALPSVARTMNFRFTVRDNRAGGSANNSDDMVVTVNSTAGPFTVSSPNTAVSYPGNSSQTITWNVAGTTANGVNCANVDILLSTDGGNNFNTVLLAGTPNDGSQSVTIPNTPGNQNRIMIKGTNHIFFDISNSNFTITQGSGNDTTAPSAPTNLTAAGTTQTTTNLSWTSSTDNVAVTGYNVFQGGTQIGTATTTTFAVTGLSPATTYNFTVKAKDAAGNISATSNTATITTLTGTTDPTYCDSKGNSVNDEYIGRVQFNTIDNSSNGSNGYTNFTNISTSVSKGTSYNITITPTWTGTVYSEGYAVWIDYNKDGDFTDAGELVWSKTASQTTPVTGSFIIPSSAITGTTRMRVSMKYNGVPTSCEAFSYGEVEDYSVNIGTSVPDTTAPSTPTLSASGTTQTSTTLSWTASTDNVGVTGYNVYQAGTQIGTATTTTYSVTGLTPATTYAYTVKAKDAAGNLSATSNTASVTTLSNSVTYCTSQGNNTNDERIAKVEYGSINNSSAGTAGYEDFTAITTSVSRGTSQTITITPLWTGTVYSEGYAVWIDFNQDGDFTDAGEQVITIGATKNTPVSGSISIPTNANLGATRMRVSMKYNGTPTSCESFTYGQVEDYSINITASTRDNENTTSLTLESEVVIYPNPTTSLLNINSISNNATYKVHSLLGQTVLSGKIANNSIDVSRLNAGNYIIEITDNEKTISKQFIKQ